MKKIMQKTLDLSLTATQKQFIDAKADEVLFGGAAGGGKSYGQLVDALLYALRYPKSRQLVLRRTFPELEHSIIYTSLQFFPADAATYRSSSHRWEFLNGSLIEFGYCAAEKDVLRYQGAEYDQQRYKLQSLKDAPQEFKGHSLIPGAFLLPGKVEKPFICIKHACHLLLSCPHLSPVYGPPTSEHRGDTASAVPHAFPRPGFFPVPPRRFGLHR